MTEPTTIRTERIVLRPLNFDDVKDVLAYASDPEWPRFLPVPKPYTLKDAEEFLARKILQDWDKNPSFAIEYDGTVVGNVELGIETPLSVASLHYAIARPHWNQGLMTEAASAVVDWGLQRI